MPPSPESSDYAVIALGPWTSRQDTHVASKNVVPVAFENERSSTSASSMKIVWLRFGQLSRNDFAVRRPQARCVSSEKIAPKIFDLRPTFRRSNVAQLKRNLPHYIRAIAGRIKKGVELLEATPGLGSLMPGADFLLGPKLTEARADWLSLHNRQGDSRIGIGSCRG